MKMYSLILVVFAVSAYSQDALTESAPTTEGFIPQPIGTPVRNETENRTQVLANPWRNIPWTRQELSRGVESRNLNGSKRKSRIVGGLAFLAGLGVGGLAGAASTGIRNLAKYPEASLTLNLGGSKATPYFAPVYEPYAYVPHPYMYPPYGFYPFLDPMRLQSSLGGIQSLQQQALAQTMNQVDDQSQNQPVDSEKYEQEDKRVENENSEVVDDKKSNDRVELQAETDQNAEEKITGIPCNIQKLEHTAENPMEQTIRAEEDLQEEDLQEEADGSGGITHRQIQQMMNSGNSNGTTRPHHHHHHHNHTDGMNSASTPPTMHTNFTMQPTPHHTRYPRPPATPPVTYPPAGTPTPSFPTPPMPTPRPTSTNSPFYGYYGGHPQQIDHVHLTTESSIFQPEEYPSSNFNLPFDKPANFMPEERFNYYANPSISPYYPNQYVGPIPQHEFQSNNYYNLLNTPDHGPQFPNGFRPIL